MKRVEGDTISSLDGVLADSELARHFLAGFLGDTVHDENEAAKDVEAVHQNVGSFDEKLKILR